VGVLHYHDIRGSKLTNDAMVFCLVLVSSPPSPDVALCTAEKTKIEKYSEGVRNEKSPWHPLHSLCGHGIWRSRRARHGFFTGTRYDAAFEGMHMGKLLASCRRKVSLAVHVAHVCNVLRGLSAAADAVEAASSSAGMPSLATAFFTRAMVRKRLRASSRGA
jgi:hypothetical protein